LQLVDQIQLGYLQEVEHLYHRINYE
jgi:hypothetical protein